MGKKMNRYEILRGKESEEEEVEEGPKETPLHYICHHTTHSFDNIALMLDYVASHEGDWVSDDNSLMRTVGFRNEKGERVSIDLIDYKRTMYMLPGHLQKSLHLVPDRTELIKMLRKK